MALRKIVRVLAVLAAAALLALILYGPTDALLREPLSRLWWLMDSLPQQLIWVVLSIIGFVVILSLAGGSHVKQPEPLPRRSVRESQLERLAALIQLGQTSGWARDVLGQRLRETAARLRALREGMPLDSVRAEIRTGRWPTQPRVAALLLSDKDAQSENLNYPHDLAYALDVIERYAQGGSFEAN
jgi:hypothetical protein